MSDEPKVFQRAKISSGVGEGWWPYIEAAATLLDKLAPGWEPTQIKEKFGGLRFYVSLPEPAITRNEEYESLDEFDQRKGRIKETWRAVIQAAEWACARTCERCGKDGELRNIKYWYVTLCDECCEKEIARRENEERDAKAEREREAQKNSH